MLIPYLLFLAIYLLGVLVVLLFGLSSLWHLLRYGSLSFNSVSLTLLMIAGTVIILFLSYRWLSAIDWSQTFDLTDFIFNLNPFK